MAGVARGSRVDAALAPLVRAHELGQLLLREVSTGLVAIDSIGRVIFLNATAERILGVPATDCVGLDVLRVVRTLVPGENILMAGLDGDLLISSDAARTAPGGTLAASEALALRRS